MKPKLLLPFLGIFAAFVMLGAPVVFVHPLPASGELTDYGPFIGLWRVESLDDSVLPEPIKVKTALVSSNQMRVTISHSGSQTEKYCFIANVQNERFVCLPDLNGSIHNIYKVAITNSGARLELTGIAPSQVESDILHSNITGTIEEYSRGLKHLRITNDSASLQSYIATRIGSFTNKWLTLEKDQ